MNDLVQQFENDINIEKKEPATKVYMWGSAECDQFDLRDAKGEEQSECKRPYLINTFLKENLTVINIACGGLHTLFLTNQGMVYASGCNDVFALGRAENEISDRIPQLVDLPIRVNMISAGDSHSVAANSQESLVYFWGVYKNTNGNMQNPVQKPTRIGAEIFQKPLKKLLSGYNHTMVLMDKKVYLWGDSDTKVLGRKSITRQCIQQSLRPEALGVSNVLDVYTGGYHSFVRVTRKVEGVRKDCYYGWGLNNYGQLGIGSTEDALIPTELLELRGLDLSDIVGGEHHTLALEANGDVYSWGRHDDGQIGLGSEVNEELKQQAQSDRITKLEELRQRSQKSVQSHKKLEKIQENIKFLETSNVIGYQFVTKPKKIEQISKIQQIVAAGHYSYAYSLIEQQFYSWGLGYSYVLGNREDDSVYEPFEIPKQIFKNEKVLKISLGGQHVTYISTPDHAYSLQEISTELLKVDESIKLPKLKHFRKQVPLSDNEKFSGETPQDSKVIKVSGRKKREIIQSEPPAPQSQLLQQD